MKNNLWVAFVIAGGLMAGGLLNGGIYQMLRGDQTGVYRLNRFTGTVSACAIDGGCHVIGEGKPLRSEPKGSS